MGCDRGVDGVCIWVLILSLGCLLIQVHLLRLGPRVEAGTKRMAST